MEKIVESFELYGKQYRLETGELAKQASGAVLCTQGDTTVLVTSVISKEEKDYDFFPLTGAEASIRLVLPRRAPLLHA